MNIKVLSEEVIKPSSPTPNNLRYLQASLIDHVYEPTLTPMIFFYSKKTNTNQALARLKGALPKTLTMFYPLAGRIHNDNNFICNDEGVPYVYAAVDKPLEDVVHKMDVCHLDGLFPSCGKQGFTTLLLAIQVNSFACGGLAIGLMMSHAISDVFSILMFVKAWASMAKGNDDKVTFANRPCFEISKIFPPPPPHVKKMCIKINTPVINKWFMFNEAKIISLQSKLISYINTNNENNSGMFGDKINTKSLAMVLSAFIYRRINVACDQNYNVTPREVLHQVNLRNMVSPMHENSYYFGNMAISTIAKPSLVVGDEDNNSSSENNDVSMWYDFMKGAKVSIEKFTSNGASFVSDMKEGKEDLSSIKEHFERKQKGEVVSIRFSNLRSLPAYEPDFGWGKPIWVTFGEAINYKDVVILINEGPSSKNIMAYVCLSREDMAKLESDGEFNAAVFKRPSARSKL